MIIERQGGRHSSCIAAAPFFHGRCVHDLLLRGPRKFARETVRIVEDEDARTDNANAKQAIGIWKVNKKQENKFANLKLRNCKRIKRMKIIY